jgi:hypothetical protein
VREVRADHFLFCHVCNAMAGAASCVGDFIEQHLQYHIQLSLTVKHHQPATV